MFKSHMIQFCVIRVDSINPYAEVAKLVMRRRINVDNYKEVLVLDLPTILPEVSRPKTLLKNLQPCVVN